MPKRVLITGGTGNLGHRVAAKLQASGFQVRILTRQIPANAEAQFEWAQGHYLSRQGLAQALADVDTVLHTAHDPKNPKKDLLGVQNLLQACLAANVGHFTQVGIVGANKIPSFSYYAAKTRAEQLVWGSGLNVSVFQASQFHSFVLPILAGLARLPIVVVPAAVFQPVDIDEVASAWPNMFAGVATLQRNLWGHRS